MCFTRINQPLTMSKTFNTKTATNTKTPYCKVCHDAGRPESEYTSHYVKDQPGPAGKVVCPTLLNQSCRICQQTGHTSTYCPRYRPRQPADERPRYIERDERPREERPRYIERDERPRRESDRRDVSFNRLREDTDRHERDIRVRDDAYNREQDRRSKPWLQAALSTTNPRERRGPYAHPHGPRVRLELESRALSSSAVVAAPAVVAAAVAAPAVAAPAVAPTPFINVMKADLHHATNWCDEEPEQMADEMFQQLARENRHDDYISKEDDDLITMSLGGGHIRFAGYD
jgi:hypothetical protein